MITETVANTANVPTITDNLFKQGTIDTESIGISFCPSVGDEDLVNGEMTFGAVDKAKYTGEINYVPITNHTPANRYWGIDQDITYDGKPIMTACSGIVDTGSTLLLLATDAFEKYKAAIGAVMDESGFFSFAFVVF